MKKTYLIIILLALLLVVGYFLFSRDRDVEVIIENDEESEVLEEEEEGGDVEERNVSAAEEALRTLERSVVIIPDLDIEVPLSGGEASFDAGVGVDGYITLGSTSASVVVDGRDYMLVEARMSTGGSGSFDYVFAFRLEDGSATHTGSAYIGDRIIIENIEASSRASGGANVSVDMLTREEGEALASEPTTPQTLEFVLTEEGELEG